MVQDKIIGERGPNVIDVGHDHKEIYKAFNKITNKKINKSLIYGDGNAGKRIADKLEKVKISLNKEIYFIMKIIRV